jgi:hypothetical protein
MAFTRQILFVLIGMFLFVSTAMANNQISIGQAAVVRGEVYVERNTNKQPLKARDSVYQGDKILTGEKGKVQIIFADDTIFTIGREAEILLDKYVYDPSTHEGVSEIKAKKGTFKFVTGKIAKKNPKHVRVKTPFATIGVRGSGGLVDVALNGATTVGLTQCCLDLFANGAPAGTPPVPLDGVNSYSQVTSPNQPPSIPAPMPPEMVQQLNGDLAGGFAPVEGEGIGNPTTQEGAFIEGDEDKSKFNRKQNQRKKAEIRRKRSGVIQPLKADSGFVDSFDGEILLSDGGEPLIGGGETFTDDGFIATDGSEVLLSPDEFDPVLNIDVAQTTQDDTSTKIITDATDTGAFTHSGAFRLRQLGTADREGNLSGKFLDGGGFFADFTFLSGANFSGVLPTASSAGAFGFTNVGFNGRSLSGDGFRTLNGSMVTYNLIDDVTSEKLIITTGTQLALSDLPATGISFFSFLPDHLSSSAGFFDFGAVNTSEIGMMVDWQHDVFFGGKLKIDNAAHQYSLNVGFGGVGSGVNAMDGFSYSFDGGIFGEGVIDVDTVYGTGSTVDGFVVETATDAGNNFTNTISRFDINPVVVTTATASDIATLADRTDTETLVGFAAGHMRRNVNDGSGGYFMQLSSGASVNNILIDKTAGSIGASFNLFGASSYEVDAQFGDAAAGSEQIFIADELYAMEQGAMQMGISGSPLTVQQSAGILVSEVVAEQKCDTCQYAHWGVWAAKVDEANVTGQTDSFQDVVHLLPYVVGNHISLGDMSAVNAAALSINHSGIMFGSLVNAGNISHHYGNFNLVGTFGTGFDFNGNFAGFNLHTTGTSFTSARSFGSASVSVVGDASVGGATGVAVINGAFFGPNAQEVGGNFDFTAGTYDGAGIFVGAQP